MIIEHPYYGWLGILLKKSTGIKLIIHSHNIESQRFKSVGKWWWKILWHYEKIVHKNADFTFCKTTEDKQYLVDHYKISSSQVDIITYGIEWNNPPSPEKKAAAKKALLAKYNLPEKTKLFLFNGTLNYGPNYQAVKYIIGPINTICLTVLKNYKIIICGKGLPLEDNELKEYADRNIIYAGFVEDINAYFLGADVFINPVIDGGGIKTKLVEAIASDMFAISCSSGAIGVDHNLCNGKLAIVKDQDWKDFAIQMSNTIQDGKHITKEFFDHFYWGNIARKAAATIDQL